MLLKDLSNESRLQLSILQNFTTNILGVDLIKFSKQIRDNIDPLEGHLTNTLNSKGNYNHSVLKYDCPSMSVKALELRNSGISQFQFNKQTHREHAKPLKIMLAEMEGMGGQQLLDYLCNNLKSVTILKEEAKLMDTRYKTTMPDVNNIYSRFEVFNINIVPTK